MGARKQQSDQTGRTIIAETRIQTMVAAATTQSMTCHSMCPKVGAHPSLSKAQPGADRFLRLPSTGLSCRRDFSKAAGLIMLPSTRLCALFGW